MFGRRNMFIALLVALALPLMGFMCNETNEEKIVIGPDNMAPFVLPIPDQAVYVSEALALDVSPYVYDATDADTEMTYTVTSGQGTFVAIYHYTSAFVATGTYTIEFQVEDTGGKLATGTFDVVVSDPPVDYPPTIIDPPDQEVMINVPLSLDISPYVYDDNDTDLEMTYAVTTGLGSFTSTYVYGNTFAAVGTYSVDFEVEDTAGNVSTGSFDVTVVPTSASPVILPIPDQTAYANVAFSLDMTSYVWDDVDAVADMTFTVTTGLGSFAAGVYENTFVSEGAETVYFSVEDTDGYVSTGSFDVTVVATSASPVILPIPDQTTPVNVAFALDMASYVWDDVDAVADMTFTVTTGLGSFAAGVYENTFVTEGAETVYFSVEDTDGYVSAGSFDIHVYLIPIAEFGANSTTGAVPHLVQFGDLSTGTVDAWAWDFDGDGSVDSTSQNPTHVYDFPGSYTVSLKVSCNGGEDTETKADYIVVTPTPPGASFSASVTEGTAPLDVDFTDESTGDVDTWVWNFGNGADTSAAQHPSYSYTDAGVYAVALTVTGPGGTDTFTRYAYIQVRDVTSNTWYVDAASVAATPDGLSWATAFPYIQSGIDAATDYDLVLVADGTYTGAMNRNLNFGSKSIYLQAYDYYGSVICTINCENTAQAFIFDDSETKDAVVDGFTITNGYATGHGGALFFSNASPTILNCTITNCNANYGGAIGGYGSSSMPVISGCTIENNDAIYGGGISLSEGTITITDCMIKNNYADSYGGGCMFWEDATAYMQFCDVKYNEANESGGGIWIDESWDSLIMNDCNVDWNDAYYVGGGICSENTNATLTNCSVSNNSIDGDDYEACGGGIAFEDGILILSGCDVSDNTISGEIALAIGCGAYVYSDSEPTTLLATNCTFNRNSGQGFYGAGGGGIFTEDAFMELTGCTASYNRLQTMGIISETEEPIIGAGGGILTGGETILTNCVISYNNIDVMALMQDMAFVWGGGVGAGFMMEDPMTNVTMTNCTVTDNNTELLALVTEYFAAAGGVGIYSQSASLDNCSVLRNNLSVTGMAMDTSECGGGGAYIMGEMIDIQNSNISNNSVSSMDYCDAGGLYVEYNLATLTNCTISANSADAQYDAYGGGVYAIGAGPPGFIILEDCDISDNSAHANNEVSAYGGGAYVTQTYADLFNCLVTNNHSEHYGGGFYFVECEAEIMFSTIADNHAEEYGGGIYSYAEAYVYDSIIWGNTANYDGNQVYDDSDTVYLDYCIVPNDTQDPDRFYGSVIEELSCINANPLFVTGPRGNYYLNQLLSPAMDAGDCAADECDMETKTTATNGMPDSGIVDIGHHYEP